MRSGTLKREPLVFQGKDFGSRGGYGGVFDMNQDPLSGKQNDCREPQCDEYRKGMRHLFPGLSGHDERRSYYRDLTPQSNFISLF